MIDRLRVSLKVKKKNEVISKTLGVACITVKAQKAKLIWCSHVLRREDESCMHVKTYDSRGQWMLKWGDGRRDGDGGDMMQ